MTEFKAEAPLESAYGNRDENFCVHLISTEGKVFEVPFKVAKISGLVISMIPDGRHPDD
jgi:hypothetical protein